MDTTVLIAGRRPDFTQALADWLRDEGHTAQEVPLSAKLPALIAERQPALLLIEALPDDSQVVELVERLQAEPGTADLAIFLLLPEGGGPGWTAEMLDRVAGHTYQPVSVDDLGTQLTTLLRRDNLHIDTARLLAEFTRFVLASLPCDLVWLLEADPEGQVLESRSLAAAWEPVALPPQIPFVLINSAFDNVLRRGSPVLNVPVGQLADVPALDLLHREIAGLGYISLVPLRSRGRASGLVALGSTGPFEHSERIDRLVSSLAQQAVIALDYADMARSLVEQEEIMEVEQAFLHMILDTMGDGLVVISETGEIEFVNNRLVLMSGYEREDLFGQPVGMLFHPDDREEVMHSLLRGIGSTMKFDQRLYSRTGKVLPVLLSRSSFARMDPDAGQQVLVLSDLTEQKSREAALERQSQQLQALNHANQVISSSLSPREVIMQILSEAVVMVDAQGASILLRAEDNPDELVFMATVGPQSKSIEGMRVPIGQGVAGYVARQAESQLVPDTSQDERFYRNIDDSSGLTTRSLIAVPLIVSERVIGVLEVINKQNGNFTSADMELLEDIAGTAAVALENARLYEQTRRRMNDLGTLLDASAAVSSTLDFGSVLELIARRLVDALDVERCLISSWDRTSNVLRVLAEVADAYWGPGAGPVSPLNALPLQHAALVSGQPSLGHVNDPALNPLQRKALLALGQQALLAVPLWIAGRAVGLVVVYTNLPQQFFTDTNAERVERAISAWQTRLRQRAASGWRTREALTDLCNRVQGVSGGTWVAIEEWVPSRSLTCRLFESGFSLWPEERGVRYELRELPSMTRALSVGQPKVIARKTPDLAPREQEFLARLGGQVGLMAPLLIRGNPEGLVFLLDSDDARVFDPEEISLCQGIANVVGNAMENAQLYQSLERRAEALEAAYEELKQADLLKDELLQNLSHEIQTPLLHILGYIELMHSGAFGPLNAEQQEKLEFVVQRARHLSDLVKNIVAVQALQNHPLDKRPCHIEEILQRAVRNWLQPAGKRSIEIGLQVPRSMPTVLADERLLTEAVEHLLDNAIKFSPDGARIDVVAYDRPAEIEVHVQDEGIGIPEDAKARIFQRFYQIDGSATRKYGGAGLGLAIVQDTVTQHGGRIWVESELGRGSTFFFTIPKLGGPGSPPADSRPQIKRLKPSS